MLDVLNLKEVLKGGKIVREFDRSAHTGADVMAATSNINVYSDFEGTVEIMERYGVCNDGEHLEKGVIIKNSSLKEPLKISSFA